MSKFIKYIFLLLSSFSLLLSPFLLSPALSQEYREINQTAFDRGEHLEYKVYWDAWILPHIKAGVASFTVTDDQKMMNDRSTYHVICKGQSKGLLNMIHKVNDRYESYFDDQAIIPWHFKRRTREGNYERDDHVVFDHQNKWVTSMYAERGIAENVQDMISALYYARTMDFSTFEKGDHFDVDFFMDDSVYVSRVIFEGVDTLKIGTGTFRCMKFKHMVLVGPVFDQPYPMTLWITDDKNRIPIFAESKLKVGSVKLEITYFEGLNNPLTSMIEEGRKMKEASMQSRRD